MIIFMRIDRLLCEMNIGTRSQVKELIKKGQICVNGSIVIKPDMQVEEADIVINCQGKDYCYRKFVYYMMNKPSGIITATKDARERTVLDLFREQIMELNQGELSGVPVKDIFPVGRLDKDSVGLLLLTNDGELSHRLLSPRKHVPKTYLVRTNLSVSDEMIRLLETGVSIGEDEKTLPAVLEQRGDREYLITITEGKYHQVKRMFQAVGVTVIYLKRLSMGTLVLDETLLEGQIRELTKEEVSNLCLKI